MSGFGKNVVSAWYKYFESFLFCIIGLVLLSFVKAPRPDRDLRPATSRWFLQNRRKASQTSQVSSCPATVTNSFLQCHTSSITKPNSLGELLPPALPFHNSSTGHEEAWSLQSSSFSKRLCLCTVFFRGLGAEWCFLGWELSAPSLPASSTIHALFYLSPACHTSYSVWALSCWKCLFIAHFWAQPFSSCTVVGFHESSLALAVIVLRCFWKHLKYGISWFSQPFRFTENVAGASASSILLLSAVSKRGKNGKILNKAAKSYHHIPTTSLKSNFFLK